MLNKIIIEGRLTHDPEVKTLTNGSVARMRVANDVKVGQKSFTTFIDVDFWDDRQVQFISQWFKKGKPVRVEGRVCQDTWEKDGERRSKIYVRGDRVDFVTSWTRPEDAKSGEEVEETPVENSEDIPF